MLCLFVRSLADTVGSSERLYLFVCIRCVGLFCKKYFFKNEVGNSRKVKGKKISIRITIKFAILVVLLLLLAGKKSNQSNNQQASPIDQFVLRVK